LTKIVGCIVTPTAGGSAAAKREAVVESLRRKLASAGLGKKGNEGEEEKEPRADGKADVKVPVEGKLEVFSEGEESQEDEDEAEARGELSGEVARHAASKKAVAPKPGRKRKSKESRSTGKKPKTS